MASSGFTLPVVLIASVVMLMVLTSAGALISSTVSTMGDQYYNALAKDAAQSGVAKAELCIAQGAAWSDPLRPGGDCSGSSSLCDDPSCFVVKHGNVQTTFIVSPPQITSDSKEITVRGVVELLSTSSGQVWRQYDSYQRLHSVGADGQSWKAVAVGDQHTCAISVDDEVYCWGINTYGQLGNGSPASTAIDSPVPIDTSGVLTGKTVTQISAGSRHTCVVASGGVYCWGQNTYGKLGDNSESPRRSPVAVDTSGAMSGRVATQVEAGVNYTCAVASSRGYCWGFNGVGQLGNPGGNSKVPVAVTGATSGVTAITVNGSHSCLAAGKAMRCWGSNGDGRLGNGSTSGSPSPVNVNMSSYDPMSVFSPMSITTGDAHTCAIYGAASVSSGLYCWGRNDDGQLGAGSNAEHWTPTRISSSSSLADVSAGKSFTCFVNAGKVYCMGQGLAGKLGNGSKDDQLSPHEVESAGVLNGKTVESVSAGVNHACVVASAQIYCWGRNSSGELGAGYKSPEELEPVGLDTGATEHMEVRY